MSLNTPIPVQTERFWACPANKESLQSVCQDFLENIAKKKKINVVPSGSVRNYNSIVKCIECALNGLDIERDYLSSNIEEADTRIILHINDALSNEYKRIIVKSNDVDVFALLLHYIIHFKERGLKELWLQFGRVAHSRFIPMHILHERISNELSLLALKLHVLMGCDMTSSIGTKNSALKAKPECYLKGFGERLHLGEDDAVSAVHYLTRVLSPSSDSLSFDQL